ncbi:DNA polymerase III subunit beta [Vibrio variabilis]|uniref:DNA polymerase III subunit beta n=1 Tax=Vibrio variabilis TaxID=990271 RepID=A0ABR4Y9L4_9VIBR|nr:hypothetical protein [Vibrio variabilis]KHA60159.1 DNA polymerase III subunit beta [Vibrio variabilis]
MNKFALLSLSAALLAGCANEPVVWEQTNTIEVAQTNIALKSNLWVNKMPTIGSVQDSTLHGALYLESDKVLPAQLVVESLSIKQGDESWQIDGDLLDLRTHNQNQWELAFVWQFELDAEKPVDVALQVRVDDKTEWLVDTGVVIDTVY